MYAIFENGSHQYRVSPGDLVTVDRHDGEHGATLVFDKVLLVAGEGAPTIGTPVLAGATVVGTIVRQFRDKKIIIQKFRRRKNMRRKRGHRQPYTTVKITAITPA
jgi:large subunit ribosomal protein L21